MDSIFSMEKIQNLRHPKKTNQKGNLSLQIKNQLQSNYEIKKAFNVQRTNCFDTSKRFLIKTDSISYYVDAQVRAKDGSFYIAGEAGIDRAPYYNYGFILKTDVDGNVSWVKLLGVNNTNLVYYNMIQLKDNSLLVAGSTNSASSSGNNDVIFTNFDLNGSIIWSKLYKSRFWGNGTGSNDWFFIRQMIQDQNTGDVYIAGGLWSAGRCLIRLNSKDGTIIWSKLYQESGSLFDSPFGIDIRGNNLYYFGKFIDYNKTLLNVIKLNKITGDTIQIKYFNHNGSGGYKSELLTEYPLQVLNNGNYLLSGTCFDAVGSIRDGVTPIYQSSVIELDSNINFVKGYVFRNKIESNAGLDILTTMFPDNSGLMVQQSSISPYTSNVYYIQFRDAHIIRQRKVHYIQGSPGENTAFRLPDGADLTIKLLGDSIDNISKIEFRKMHPDDSSSACLGIDNYSTFIEPVNYSKTTHRFDSIANNAFQENPNKNLPTQLVTTVKLPGCTQVSFCDTLHISSSDSIICITKPLTIAIFKNKECSSLVPLIYDTNIVKNISYPSTDTAVLYFKQPWTGYISGYLQGCNMMKDSIKVTVLDVLRKVDLGPDTSICVNNTLSLNAHSGYKSYKWQDNSTDSIYIVHAPGTYTIRVINACNDEYYDTVIVKSTPPIPLSLGSDQKKCNKDTVVINAPAGFINYKWLPQYNLSSNNSQSIKAYPDSSVVYHLSAEKTPGCFAYDSIKINVYNSPSINLGADQSFCSGDSILVDAGKGFSSYLWNTGDTTESIYLKKKGNYIVAGTTVKGCQSKGGINVVQVFENPVITLNKDTAFCYGSQKVLNAGGGYASYLWNDGSQHQTLTVTEIGTYYVLVKDINGCMGTDTARILEIFPSPHDFLPTDTAICNYGKLLIKVNASFYNYLWNTGENSAAILISKPGNYYLTVADKNNCTGKDTIVVKSKQCIKGFYIPTSFSPNYDGRNDKFKPLLFGDVVKYEFKIYNRWGEKVFQSNTPSLGWDGYFKGSEEKPSVYIWLCIYQFAGEAVKQEKGTVVVIR